MHKLEFYLVETTPTVLPVILIHTVYCFLINTCFALSSSSWPEEYWVKGR
jgi:hypothetical protein